MAGRVHDDPDEVDRVFAEAIGQADTLHGNLVTAAGEVGYIRDTLIRARPYYVALARQGGTALGSSFVASGQQFVQSYGNELRCLLLEAPVVTHRVSSAAGTVVAFASMTAAVPIAVPGMQPFEFQPNPFTHSDRDGADRLSRLDVDLGRTYQAIWEALFTGRADPERSALFLMRQAFDHLFGKLAPDDDVRRSVHWTEKSGEQKLAVHRVERVAYAAATHVNESSRAQTLVAASRQMLDLYQELNQAHTRGALSKERARNALMAMKALLEEWAVAVSA